MRRSLLPRPLALVALLALLVRPGHAQQVLGDRPGITRFKWPLANALVYGDRHRGVQLTVAPNGAAIQSDLQFDASLDPAAVEEWGNRLAALVAVTDRPAEGAQYLMATMTGIWGGEVTAARQRDGNKWKRDVILNFRPANGRGFSLLVSSTEAMRFGNAVAQAGALSDRQPLDANSIGAVRAGDQYSPARVVAAARPHYPQAMWDQRIAGEVWFEAVIGQDGKAIPESMQVLLADHRGFVDAVRVALAESTFSPAMLNGRPVPGPIRYRFTFLHQYD